MKTIIRMDSEIIGEIDLDMTFFNDPNSFNSSKLYNAACKFRRNNEWKDMNCEKISYFDDHVVVELESFTPTNWRE